jgi:hypothetical protein
MVVIVENPSVKTRPLVTLLVPNGNLEVKVLNLNTSAIIWTLIGAEAFCYQNSDDIQECELFIYHEIPPFSTKVF